MNTTAVAGVIRLIDWTEVAAIVLQGLQVLIVLTLLAGRLTRRAWDALLMSSERLGRWYSDRLTGPAAAAIVAPAAAGPIVTRWSAAELGQLTNRDLRELVGTRRRLAKRELIALALAG